MDVSVSSSIDPKEAAPDLNKQKSTKSKKGKKGSNNNSKPKSKRKVVVEQEAPPPERHKDEPDEEDLLATAGQCDRETVLWIVIPFIVVIIIMAVVLGLHFSKQSSGDDGPTKQEILMEILTVPKEEPGEEEGETIISRRYETTYQQIKVYPDSPQHKAFFQFLMTDDITNEILQQQHSDNNGEDSIPNSAANRIHQRFSMATLYYATTNQNNEETAWIKNTNWLSPTISECEWYTYTLELVELENNNTNSNDTEAVSSDIPEICVAPASDSRNRRLNDGSISHEQYKTLDLNNNNLRGYIPQDIFDGLIWSKLQTLDLSNNQITNTFPPGQTPLLELTTLDLSANDFSGPFFSQEMANYLLFVQELRLRHNNFTASLDALAKMNRLTDLDGAHNSFTGTLPLTWGSPNLKHVFLDNNLLEGPIPTDLGLLVELKDVWLHNNNNPGLNGTIPSELGKLTLLETLYLANNSLSGTIPTQVTNLMTGSGALTELDVRGNPLLSGTIPSALCDMMGFKRDCTGLLCGCDCSCTNATATTNNTTDNTTTTTNAPTPAGTTAPTATPQQNVTCYFVLAGQSNVLGFANLGHLETLAQQEGGGNYSRYYNSDGQQQWTNLTNVWVTFDNEYGDFKQTQEGPLTPNGFGTDAERFGPEVGFGYEMANLAINGDKQIAPNTNCQDLVLVKSAGVGALAKEWNPANGIFFQQMTEDVNDAVTRVQDITGNSNSEALLAGVVWFHGYADVFEPDYLGQYSSNLKSWIEHLRSATSVLPLSLSPVVPVVIAQMGGQGLSNVSNEEQRMRSIQASVAADVEHTGLTNTSQFVTGFDTTNETQVFDGDYHYWGRADVMIRIGEQLAKDMWNVIQSMASSSSSA